MPRRTAASRCPSSAASASSTARRAISSFGKPAARPAPCSPHPPMLALPAELWPVFAKGDENNPELAYPPHGVVMSYQEALTSASPELRGKYQGPAPFRAQADDCQRALDELSKTLQRANPDITVIITDDQDEWFFEDNM